MDKDGLFEEVFTRLGSGSPKRGRSRRRRRVHLRGAKMSLKFGEASRPTKAGQAGFHKDNCGILWHKEHSFHGDASSLCQLCPLSSFLQCKNVLSWLSCYARIRWPTKSPLNQTCQRAMRPGSWALSPNGNDLRLDRHGSRRDSSDLRPAVMRDLSSASLLQPQATKRRQKRITEKCDINR